MLSTLLAINWEPRELRGILHRDDRHCGLDGLDLSDPRHERVGARLGFMITFTGLAGWIAPDGLRVVDVRDRPERRRARVEAGPGRTVIQQVDLLYQAGVLDDPVDVTSDSDPAVASEAVADQLDEQGWIRVGESAPEFGQAGVRSAPASSRSSPCSRSTHPRSRRIPSWAQTASSTRSRSSTSRTTRSSRSPRISRCSTSPAVPPRHLRSTPRASTSTST